MLADSTGLQRKAILEPSTELDCNQHPSDEAGESLICKYQPPDFGITMSPVSSCACTRKRICVLNALFVIAVFVQLMTDRVSAADVKPNIVLILADDLGWSDTTLFGTTKLYKTPNIERLAARGMTFTRAYSASPLCSPTRASILTGLSPARHGITSPTCHLPIVRLKAAARENASPNQMATVVDSVSRLDTRYYTLAETLSDNGYATGHFGKWHLGAEPYSPLEHGFDVDVPHHPGPGPAGSYVAPWRFKDFDHDPMIPDEHIEDRMAKEADKFIRANRKKPFFLNYWMFSVHAPFDAKKDLIEKYRDRVAPEDAQRSPTYAAMIESMDDAVGSLLDTLDDLGIAENTIVVFASDNGGNMYNEVDDTTPTSNTPLRGGKATMFEGGVRGPAIFVSPGRIEAGSRSDEVIQSCDFYPTLLEMLGIKPQPNQIFDGISIVPALEGGQLKRDSIYTYFPHQTAVPDWLPPSVSVHQGDWKLIRLFHGRESGEHRYKLFNLRSDIGEQHDVAAEDPERVRELDRQIEAFLVKTRAVQPVRNPRFDAAQYDASLEGVARSRRQQPNQRKPVGRQRPVAGWSPGGTSKVTLDGTTLVIQSTGGDPHVSHNVPEIPAGQELTLKFTLSSNARGGGLVFWEEKGVTPRFFRERSVAFSPQHDGEPHSYEVRLKPDQPVLALRIDPSTGAGRIRLSDVRLVNSKGTELFRWQPPRTGNGK